MSDPLMLTPTQAASLLGIGRTRMFELLRLDREGKDGGIPSVLLSPRKRLVPRPAIEDYARRLADGQIVCPRPPRRLRAAPEKGPPSP